MNTSFFRYLLASSVLLLNACSNANFAGGSQGQKKPSSAQDSDVEITASSTNDSDPSASAEGLPAVKDGRVGVEVFGQSVKETFLGSEKSAKRPDIVFLVDTSGSMQEEKEELEKKLASFLLKFSQIGIEDYKIYMVGSNFSFPTDIGSSDNFEILNVTISSNNSLSKFIDIIDGEITVRNRAERTWETVTIEFREDASKDLIVVTDDNSSLQASDFREAMKERQLSDLYVNGLVGLKQGRNSDTCDIAEVGSVYQELAVNQVQTKGLIQDLCASQYDDLLTKLANTIINKIRNTRFTLTHTLSQQATIKVTIDGIVVDPKLYKIDYEQNMIEFNGSAAPAAGQTVIFEYEKMTE